MPHSASLGEAFDRLAGHYDEHAALEQEVGRRLLERCEFRRREPKCIVDLGCGTGHAALALKRMFRRAQVVGLDTAPGMLLALKRRSTLFRRLQAVCGDLAQIPLAERSADLLFSNLALHWSTGLHEALDEVVRLLSPQGLLLFSTLGPGTLAEFRDSWSAVDPHVRFMALPDALQVGDALLGAGFREPVVDTERISLHYPSLPALAEELEATGSHLLFDGWPRWRQRRADLEVAFAPLLRDGRYSVSFEIVYGTAFGPDRLPPRRRESADVVSIPLDNLLKSRPMG